MISCNLERVIETYNEYRKLNNRYIEHDFYTDIIRTRVKCKGKVVSCQL